MAVELTDKANRLIEALGDLGLAQERQLDNAAIEELTRRASLARTEFAATLQANGMPVAGALPDGAAISNG